MRLLFINQFYTPDTAATAQLLADLTARFVARGHEVHVLCSRRAYAGGDAQLPKRETVQGVTVHRVGGTGFGRANLLLCAMDYASFYALAVWRALTLPRPDVCLTLTTPPFIGLVGALLRGVRRTRLVLWSMDLYPDMAVVCGVVNQGSPAHRILAAAARFLYGRCDAIVSLGEVMSQRLERVHRVAPSRIATVHNWVPGEVVRPVAVEQSVRRKQWNPDRELTLMYSGNLGFGHDLETPLRAVARLDPATAPRFIIVGTGRQRQVLEALAKELRLDRVAFYDPQPIEELGDSLAAGDIHIVSQRLGTEGISVTSKLYGVLAAGRPALFIGPPACEAARILQASRAGIVCEPGDVDGIADGLRKLVADPSLRADMGRRAREYYEQHFGLERSVSRIVGLVESLARP